MLSRIADSLFWMNRYMERVDGILRLVSTYYNLGMDRDVGPNVSWKPVLQLFTTIQEKEMSLLENNTQETLKKLIIENGNDNSLKCMINKARENARGAQDHITKEVWEEINQMYHAVNHSSIVDKLNTYEAMEVMETLSRHTVLYAGIIDITMPRGMGWNFMSIGRYLERCLQTIVITEKQIEMMDNTNQEENDILQWRYLLLSLSGYELHLKTYRSSNHNFNVLHQVLVNENFTRSVLYSLNRIEHYLNRVINHKNTEGNTALLNCFGRLHGKVRFMEMNHLSHEPVKSFLRDVKKDLMEFNRQLGQQFFSYS